MREKPTPKAEIVVESGFSAHALKITYASPDARTFIATELPTYGQLHLLAYAPEATLFVHSTYDVDEVAEYIRSYND